MNSDELYTQVVGMVPVKAGKKEDFRSAVMRCLNNYKKLLKDLAPEDQPADWNVILARVDQLCDGIRRAINYEYQGLRHSAYASIKNQLDGYNTKIIHITPLAYDKNVLNIPSNTISYRMRKVDLDEQHNLERKDMFHVPLEKRGLVQTQRYSVPGYPCLYLSNSVYGCWEEMGRPDFGTVMVSKFVSREDIKVLDLRIPSKKTWQDNMGKCTEFFPLVIASMVQVKNVKDSYKPEYLIPQLLTEWVISHNVNEKKGTTSTGEILGILFTSARKNKDFDFQDNKYDNYAIPVLKPLGSKKYCERLTKIFELSAPTYYDLEVLKNGDSIDRGSFGSDDVEQQKIDKYDASHFGFMESILDNAEMEAISTK